MQKTAGSKKFSFYLISRIDGVKTCKNWFLRHFFEFEVSVRLDTAYWLSTDQFLVVGEWVTDIFSRFDCRQYAK